MTTQTTVVPTVDQINAISDLNQSEPSYNPEWVEYQLKESQDLGLWFAESYNNKAIVIDFGISKIFEIPRLTKEEWESPTIFTEWGEAKNWEVFRKRELNTMFA